MNVIKHHIYTPHNDNHKKFEIKIFLAGSIDNGQAAEWQHSLVEDIVNKASHLPEQFARDVQLTFFNPRNDNWDPNNKNLRSQILWELDHISGADLVIFNFLPDSKSPITLLELGLCLGKGYNVVGLCPLTFYRSTNVHVTSNYVTNASVMFHNYTEFLDAITRMITEIYLIKSL